MCRSFGRGYTTCLRGTFPWTVAKWGQTFCRRGSFHGRSFVPVTVMFSPGHTLASITYVAGDGRGALCMTPLMNAATSGQQPRRFFPGGGSSNALFDSIANDPCLLPRRSGFPVGHDYAPGRGERQCEADRGAACRTREHPLAGRTPHAANVSGGVRDARGMPPLPVAPSLCWPRFQVNISGGAVATHPEGKTGGPNLKIPLKPFRTPLTLTPSQKWFKGILR